MQNTKVYQVTKGSVVLNDNQSYDISTGEVLLTANSEKVRLHSIANYLTNKTGKPYSVFYGVECLDEPNTVSGECVLIAPTSYDIVDCGANYNSDTEEYHFYARNSKGEDVYDNQLLFLWSFDMAVDNEGYFVFREGAKNGIICLDMIDRRYGLSDEDIDCIQNS